jgi:hypothetical protein
VGVLPHDHARSRAFRWNEDGIAGLCNRHQSLCFAVAMWNSRDPIPNSTKMFLVAPDDREREVQAQLNLPSVQAANGGAVSYILFSDLAANCDAMCRFGSGREILDKIARSGY